MNIWQSFTLTIGNCDNKNIILSQVVELISAGYFTRQEMRSYMEKRNAILQLLFSQRRLETSDMAVCSI